MKQKLIVTRGIPGSGKSTFAREWVAEDPENRRNSERDIIRVDLFKYEKRNKLPNHIEDEVTRVQDEQIKGWLSLGHSVIVSDTNLSNLQRFRDMAIAFGAAFEVIEFNTPLEVCLQRNSERPENERIPEEVIIKMHKRFTKMKKSKYKVEERPLNVSSEKINAFMFDLDGTARIFTGRSPYDSKAAVSDAPNMSVVAVLQGLMTAYPDAIFIAMSGASNISYEIVEEQLKDFGISPDFLFMRKEGDYRSDVIVKQELFNRYVKDNFNVICVFDDRKSVCDMWRSLGLHVFQVAPGDF